MVGVFQERESEADMAGVFHVPRPLFQISMTLKQVSICILINFFSQAHICTNSSASLSLSLSLTMEFRMSTTANNTTFALSSSGFSLLEWWVAQHLSINNLPSTTLLLLLLGTFVILFPPRNLRFPKPNNSLPPGPAPWPLIGCLPAICRNKPSFRWILKMMEEMDTNIACIRLGNTHVIPVTCPKISREFLKKQDALFATRPVAMAPECISRGYLTTAITPWGDQWKKMRRVVACELLHPTKLRGLLHKRTGEADNLVRCIHAQCCMNASGDALVDVREATRHYCGNVIRKLVFNVRHFGAGRGDGGPGLEEEEHVEAVFTALSLLDIFDVADYLPMLRCLDLEGHEKIMKRAIEVVNKYHDPIIDDRIMRWRSGGAGADNINGDPEDMLDMMILAKDGNGNPSLSAEEIKAQITVILPYPDKYLLANALVDLALSHWSCMHAYVIWTIQIYTVDSYKSYND